ncbi:hypothetical protein ABEF95_001761 [Exophiala dermatitidis]
MKSMSDLMVQSDLDWRRQRAADSQTQRQYQFDYQNRTHCLVPSQPQHFQPQTLTTSNQPAREPAVAKSTTTTAAAIPATKTTRTGPPALTTTSSSSSIQITTRTNLSLLYRLLRLAIRPLRPRLVAPPKTPFPAGSIRLFEDNDHGVKRKWGSNVIESRREEVWEYTFRPDPADPQQHESQSQKIQDKTTGWNEDEKQKPADGSQSSQHRRHQVYYFAGGGFQAPPSGEHWLFLAQLAKECGEDSAIEIGITLVSYPLAPSSPAVDSLPILRKWLSHVLDEARLSGDTVILVGDSSGGNIALSLGFWAVEHYEKDEMNAKSAADKGTTFPLRSVICISPPVDMRNTNPAIPEHDKVDPVLTMGLTERVARGWTAADSSKETSAKKISYSDSSSSSSSASSATSQRQRRPWASSTTRYADAEPQPAPYVPFPFSAEDPSTSPLLNPESAFRALKERGVSVHGVIGTHDVLAPDALEFLRRCESQGIDGRWLVWEGQMHCFPLAGGYRKLGLREGRLGRQFVLDVLRNDAGRH